MKQSKAKFFKILLGLLVSAGFLVWIFSSTDWSLVRGYLADLQWIWIIPALILIFLHFLLRAWRWKLLLPPETKASQGLLFDSIMFGNLATFLLPLRAGEFLRPWLLSTQSSVPFATGFASVVVERFFDLSAVLISFALLVQFGSFESSALTAGAWALGSLAACICIFLILGSFLPEKILQILTAMSKILPKKIAEILLGLAKNVLEGASLLRSPVRVAGVLLLTVLIWISAYGLFDVFLRLFQFPTSALFAVSIGVTIALAVALPSAPGFIGVYQSACVFAFQQFGLNQEQAVAYSIINHLFQYVVFVLYGLVIFSRYRLGWSSFKR